jgi:acetyl esterase/lipase
VRELYIKGEPFIVVKTRRHLHDIPWLLGIVWNLGLLGMSAAGMCYMLGWIAVIEPLHVKGFCGSVDYFEANITHALAVICVTFLSCLWYLKPIFFLNLYTLKIGDSIHPLFAIPAVYDQISLYIQANYKIVIGVNIGYCLSLMFWWALVITHTKLTSCSFRPGVKTRLIVMGVVLGLQLLLNIVYGVWYVYHVLPTCCCNQLRLMESNNTHWNMFCKNYYSIHTRYKNIHAKSLIPKQLHTHWTPKRGEICISRDIVFTSVYSKNSNNTQTLKIKSHHKQADVSPGLMLDIYRPALAALSQHNIPVVIHIHGGGFMKGSKRDISRCFLEAVMRSGSMVISPEYRLAPYATVKEQVRDILACIQWMETNGQAAFHMDLTRVTIAGSSAGAFLAVLVALQHKHYTIVNINTDNPDSTNHGISKYQTRVIGYIGLYGLYTTTDPVLIKMFKHTVIQSAQNRDNDMMWLESSPEWWSSSLSALVHQVKHESKHLPSYSKTQLAHHAYFSTFLIHGTQDAITSCKQTQHFHQRLKRDNSFNLNLFFPIEHGHHAFDFVPDAKSELVTDAIHLYLVWNNHQSSNLTDYHWVQNTEEKSFQERKL